MAAPDGASLSLLRVPHGGKGAAVRAGMLAATADLVVFADADMATPPDQLPLLVAALADHDVALGSRIQPDGSDMRTSQPRYRRALGKAFHVLASAWAAGPVQDTQCGFKGFRREAAHDLFAAQVIRSIVFDVELIYLARRRGYRHRDRPGPLVRPARIADAAAARPGADRRLGPVPHPAPPSRCPPRPARPDASRLTVALARAALPVLAILVFAGSIVAILATAGDTWGYDYQAYAQAAQRLLDGQPLYDPAVDLAGGFAIYLYPPPFAVAFVPFALLGDPAGLYAWTALLIGCTVAAVALMPISRAAALDDAAAGRPVVAAPLLAQARPGRADPAAAVRPRLALAGAAGRAGRHDRDRDADQGPAGVARRVGGADRPGLGGGRRGGGGARRVPA